MYIPKSKQNKNVKPEGNLIDPETGLKFNGKFIQDFLGNFFKGDKITSNSKNLDLVPFSDVDDTVKYGSNFISAKVTPPASAYDKGTFTRYFCKDSRSNKIVELNKDRYLAEKKIINCIEEFLK